jgi:DNA-binding Lrp family transcriptional regulator
VQRRITQLEASGVILANTAVIAPEALGQELTAIVESRLCDDRSLVMDRAKRYFAGVPQVQQCYFVSGGVSFIIVMLARNVAHFEKLVRQHFADNDDIQTYRTLIVLDKVKVGLGWQCRAASEVCLWRLPCGRAGLPAMSPVQATQASCPHLLMKDDQRFRKV